MVRPVHEVVRYNKIYYRLSTGYNIWNTMISGNPLVLEVSDIASFTEYGTCR
jgi:hypothetical protein